MPGRFLQHHACRIAALAMLAMTVVLSSGLHARERESLRRTGAVMGLDPGLVLRHIEGDLKVYVRMNLRLAGCITPKIQLGGDWRMEVFAGGQGYNDLNRHEIGPVLTLFPIGGFFVRLYSHIGGATPVRVTSGGGLGYEWGLNRYSAMGVSAGGDVDILFSGNPPPAYAVFVTWYLSAYDLASRRGREPNW